MISKGFLKSSIVYTVGGALPMVGGLILLPFYANRLNDLHYAQVQFYISVSLLCQILFSYSIDSYFGIKYTQLGSKPEEQKKFVGTTSLLLLLIGGGIMLMAMLSGDLIFSRVFNPDYEMSFWPFGFYSVLTAFFNSYFRAATNALIYFRSPGIFITANLINFIATISISIGGIILYPDSIIGPIYGRLLSGVLIFLIAHFIFMKNGKFIIDQSFLPELAQFCTPYIFYAISGWVLGQIDRYILQTYISKTDLNTYDLALKCFFGIEFIQNSLSAIIFPKLYEIWNKQNVPHTTPESNRYFNAFTAINIMQLIVFCLALPIVYKLLITNKSFYDSSRYIGMIAAGYGMRSLVNFYLATILFRKKPYILLKIFGISAVIQLVITYFAIGTFGLTGAIYAGLITKILQAVLSVIFTRGIFEYRFNQSKLILIPAVYIIINIIQFHLTGSYNVYLYLSQLLLFSTIFFLVFKNELGTVWKQLLSKT